MCSDPMGLSFAVWGGGGMDQGVVPAPFLLEKKFRYRKELFIKKKANRKKTKFAAAYPSACLKGAQAWDIRERFFTQIIGLWLGDLGTGEKNWNLESWSPYFKVFAANFLLSVYQRALKN